MTIVASNSLTISNVNDGTITHTAYAYSADGTDRFTTVYPNLNLSTDTKLFTDGKTAAASKKGQVVVNGNAIITSLADFNYATFTSQGSPNQDWFRVFLIPDTGLPLMDKTEVLPNTKYTFSFFAKGTGTHRIIAYNNWAVAPNNFMDITLTSDWKLYILTVTSMATIPTNNAQFFFRSSIAGSVISVMKPKVELGSTATPYMPSASEVTTADWPSYIGQYSDFTSTASADPAKYAPWTVFKGIDGNNGRGIVGSEQKYQVTTTPAKPVDPWENSVWKTTQPTITATNKYLWSITRTTFNLAPLTQDIVEQKAVYGDKGTDGDPGKIVSDTEPTTRFKGLTWKYSGTVDLTASDGTVIKPNTEYYYNGTHWVINFLSANNIDVNSITAEKINGTDLEVKNGKFTDGVIETSWKNGTVAGSTNIENDHLIITRTDSSVNTTNSIGLDSTQGLIMVYTENSTGRTISVGTNFQGMSLTDSTGTSASISPAGVKLSSDVDWTQIGNIGGRRAEWKRENNRVTMNIHGGNGDRFPVITSGGTLLGILPTNARPPSDISMPATAQAAGATAQISINSSGEVRCYRWGGDSIYFSAYISYYVE